MFANTYKNNYSGRVGWTEVEAETGSGSSSHRGNGSAALVAIIEAVGMVIIVVAMVKS